MGTSIQINKIFLKEKVRKTFSLPYHWPPTYRKYLVVNSRLPKNPKPEGEKTWSWYYLRKLDMDPKNGTRIPTIPEFWLLFFLYYIWIREAVPKTLTRFLLPDYIIENTTWQHQVWKESKSDLDAVASKGREAVKQINYFYQFCENDLVQKSTMSTAHNSFRIPPILLRVNGKTLGIWFLLNFLANSHFREFPFFYPGLVDKTTYLKVLRYLSRSSEFVFKGLK